MEYVSLKRADIVISVSHENKRFYEKRFPWLKMEVIPVGIGDAARPLDQKKMRKELGLPLNKTIGINIGRWAPTKQVDKIVAACKGKDMQLLIAGKGNEEEKIRKAAGSNTTFLGALTHEQVIKYMNAADFFILYSKFEGLPTTVLESIACGTPVFANRVGDVPVAIEDGKNGFFINKPEDIFTRKLIPKVKNLRTSCLESAKKFRWAKVVDQILKVIQ